MDSWSEIVDAFYDDICLLGEEDERCEDHIVIRNTNCGAIVEMIDSHFDAAGFQIEELDYCLYMILDNHFDPVAVIKVCETEERGKYKITISNNVEDLE